MTIGYLTSQYPAVSHTFVLREVQALRRRGIDVRTFSVRRTPENELLDEDAREAARTTQALLPLPLGAMIAAMLWAFCTRPLRTAGAFLFALTRPAMPWRQHLLWIAYFWEAVLLAWWLHRAGYERLHCHFGNSGASTGLLAARIADIPFSMTCHGSELLEPRRYRLADKVRSADFVVCVSKHGRSQLMLATDPVHWHKLHVIHCGVEPGIGVAPGSDEDGGILCVGRLSPEKGHLVLLDALVVLKERGFAVPCRLVGDGPMRPAIVARVAELGLADRLTLTGAMAADQVMKMYPLAAMVVLPSFSEGIPVTLMEALARGLPVVATRVGGVPELVFDQRTGQLVAPGDAAELADAIQWILEHPSTATELGHQGARLVSEEFDVMRNAEQLLALFAGRSHTREDRYLRQHEPVDQEVLQ